MAGASGHRVGEPATHLLSWRGSLSTDREQVAAALLDQLRERRGAELERGVCLVGPHRDDLVLTLGPLPAKGYASHGESWSFALALRLAAYDLLRGESADGADPVLVLQAINNGTERHVFFVYPQAAGGATPTA